MSTVFAICCRTTLIVSSLKKDIFLLPLKSTTDLNILFLKRIRLFPDLLLVQNVSHQTATPRDVRYGRGATILKRSQHVH